ncbi:MAG: 50S ribosomal protein L28 [Candidatus Margulisiibacteriota bacterium]
MSRKCFACGKKTVVGNSVSHSNRHTKRKWKPNLQKVNILVGEKNKKQKEYVCVKCLKAGRVKKAV